MVWSSMLNKTSFLRKPETAKLILINFLFKGQILFIQSNNFYKDDRIKNKVIIIENKWTFFYLENGWKPWFDWDWWTFGYESGQFIYGEIISGENTDFSYDPHGSAYNYTDPTKGKPVKGLQPVNAIKWHWRMAVHKRPLFQRVQGMLP